MIRWEGLQKKQMDLREQIENAIDAYGLARERWVMGEATHAMVMYQWGKVVEALNMMEESRA